MIAQLCNTHTAMATHVAEKRYASQEDQFWRQRDAKLREFAAAHDGQACAHSATSVSNDADAAILSSKYEQC